MDMFLVCVKTLLVRFVMIVPKVVELRVKPRPHLEFIGQYLQKAMRYQPAFDNY